MNHDNFDDGLVHGHDWATDDIDRSSHPMVADASSVNTPSSVFHDDIHHAE
jgi:hypothetical protein